MVAYEFYWLGPSGGCQIIGLLPERRKNSSRVTKESIMRRCISSGLGENIFGKDFDTKDIFFIQVRIDEKTVRVYRPVPFTITQKQI